jgi:uncharacterized protein YndB with AHSA1/START domain
MLEVSVERIIFAPADRLWRELAPDRISDWAALRIEGLPAPDFSPDVRFQIAMRSLLRSRSYPARAGAVEPGKRLLLVFEGRRAGDEIEWNLYPKNNSTKVKLVHRQVPRGPLGPALGKLLGTASLRRRSERALLALEMRTTGEEAAPLTQASQGR